MGNTHACCKEESIPGTYQLEGLTSARSAGERRGDENPSLLPLRVQIAGERVFADVPATSMAHFRNSLLEQLEEAGVSRAKHLKIRYQDTESGDWMLLSRGAVRRMSSSIVTNISIDEHTPPSPRATEAPLDRQDDSSSQVAALQKDRVELWTAVQVLSAKLAVAASQGGFEREDTVVEMGSLLVECTEYSLSHSFAFSHVVRCRLSCKASLQTLLCSFTISAEAFIQARTALLQQQEAEGGAG